MNVKAMQEIISALDTVYSKLTDKEKLIAAYQLRYSVNEGLLEYYYAHIVFDDDNIFLDNIKFCLRWISGQEPGNDMRGKQWEYIDLPAVELLVCLSHMKLKDRIKVIYLDIDERLQDFFPEELEDEDEEIIEMHKAGYDDYIKLRKERESELRKFVDEEYHLDEDICNMYGVFDV